MASTDITYDTQEQYLYIMAEVANTALKDVADTTVDYSIAIEAPALHILAETCVKDKYVITINQ